MSRPARSAASSRSRRPAVVVATLALGGFVSCMAQHHAAAPSPARAPAPHERADTEPELRPVPEPAASFVSESARIEAPGEQIDRFDTLQADLDDGGSLLLARGGRVRASKRGWLVICDGANEWTRYEKNDVVTVRPAFQAQTCQLAWLVDRDASVTLRGTHWTADKESEYWVRDAHGRRMTFRVADGAGVPHHISLKAGWPLTPFTALQLEDVKTHIDLPADRFVFQVPKGVTVNGTPLPVPKAAPLPGSVGGTKI